jgi:sugar phosphate permease
VPLSLWRQVGGMAGSISAGVVSDTLVHSKRDVTSCLYAAITIPALFGIGLIASILSGSGGGSHGDTDQRSVVVTAMLAMCMFCVGVGINGPKTLMGMCAREGVPAARVGFVGGILGIVQHLILPEYRAPRLAASKHSSHSQWLVTGRVVITLLSP